MCVHSEVAGQLAGRHHSLVGNDHVGGAVVQYADDAAVLHGPSCQIAHALARTFTIEVTALQCRQRNADCLHLADRGQLADVIVYQMGHVHGDVAAVALCPSVLPQIAGHFGNLLNLCLQGRASF